MNAKSFTPGPWHVENGKDVFTALGAPNAEGICTESNDAWQIADCEHFMSYIGGYEYELSSAEQKANARLIAAAPELYEALNGLRTAMACHDSTPEEFLALANAVAALAKAVQP